MIRRGYRPRAAYHITQPTFDERMADWGDVKGSEVFESDDVFVSPVLGPDGRNLVYEREPVGFVLRRKDQ